MPTGSEIAFLFIGGAHQVFHLAPVAAELSRRQARVTCIYADAETGAALDAVATDMASDMALVRTRIPLWGRWLARLAGRSTATKIPLLLRLVLRLRGFSAVVTPERTSAFLRAAGLTRPLLMHFFHGAGDRELASDKRLQAFDVIVVAGAKDLQRTRDIPRRPSSWLRSSGYIKLDYLSRFGRPAPRLFDNGRPTVLYNPHFDATVSSRDLVPAVIAAFARQDRYNLVVAPHLRLAKEMTATELADWQSLTRPGSIIVDIDSPRLIDMSYVRATDIYLGDVSSQLYEFMTVPRPAVFINAHGAAWRNDPRYAGWHLGEVAELGDDVIAAIDRARVRHAAVVERQRNAVFEAFGDYAGAIERGAAIVAAAIDGRRGLARGEPAMLT